MAGSVGALEHLDVYENPSRFVVVGRRRVDGGTASALGYQLLVVDREPSWLLARGGGPALHRNAAGAAQVGDHEVRVRRAQQIM